MTRRQQTRQQRNRRGMASIAALIAHRAFAPIMGLWGALLGGLVVLVLPGKMIAALIAGSAIAAWPPLAQPLLALMAAGLLGGALFLFARSLGGSVRGGRGSDDDSYAPASRDDDFDDSAGPDHWVQPIDPARDLGIGSLDDPVETMPFATPAWRDVGQGPIAAPAADLTAPQALDLTQFAEFPGRNAVWVEQPSAPLEPEAQPSASPLAGTAKPADVTTLHTASDPRAAALDRLIHPSAAALARLRAVPPSELSLAEMVERFAGAMHEHRNTAPHKGLSAEDLAAREAALAQALKALATLSRDGTDESADDPLRAALARLQGLRGAA